MVAGAVLGCDPLADRSLMPSRDQLQDLYARPGFLLKRCHQISAAIFVEECHEFSLDTMTAGELEADPRSNVG